MSVRLERGRGLVCVVTDRLGLLPDGTTVQQIQALVAQARAAAAAGADLLHVRERDLPDRGLLDVICRITEAVAGTRLRVLVNDRADIAIAAGADGVHLRADGIGPAAVRRLELPLLIGQSVHSSTEAHAAARAGADFVVLGTVFPSASKRQGHPTVGVEGLRQAAADVSVPVLAIGGMGPGNVEAAAAAGAAGVAAIGWFSTIDAEKMRSAVETARRPFDTFRRLI
jgi:thiamine-phosphate pyrophosphorylase